MRNQKSGGRGDKCLTFHKLMPATLSPCSGSHEKPLCSVQPPTFCHETSGLLCCPLGMEKVEVATTAVTLPWFPNKVSFQPLICSHPAALMFFIGGARTPRSEKHCLQ